ncbi:MAG TPA: FkbM family methyltransferase [Polyangia bacterium]|jgi:FkbM family methyltransferase|nr:FkbM family methyltransferase [Polyangia bacterium]
MSAEALWQILGGHPLNLADVGASYFLPDTWSYLVPLPTATFVLFDPVGKNLAYAKNLPPDRVTVIPTALSRTGGAAEFFLANTDSGSSLFPPHPWPGRPALNHDYFFPLRIVDIETRTLAACLDERRIDLVHAIKLDTQGSELDIVKGMDARRLEQLLLVEMEVSMDSHPAQLGSARLPEVITYFEARGFRYVNTRIARKALEPTGCTGPRFAATLAAQHECDVLFIRDIAALPIDRPEWLMRALRQQVTLLCAYYQHGEAVQSVRWAAERLPAERPTCLALEQAIGRVAEHQAACLEAGTLSLWHRDQT